MGKQSTQSLRRRTLQYLCCQAPKGSFAIQSQWLHTTVLTLEYKILIPTWSAIKDSSAS